MISVCIPIYNFDVNALVGELSQQAKNSSFPIEIILIDDASDPSFRIKNNSTCKKEKYIELDKNIGRSKIRNLFVDYAQFDYLLFLDCDSGIIRKDFLECYISYLQKTKAKVVCGGRIYPTKTPTRDFYLRWSYGVFKESQNVEKRKMNPNQSFMTNNFISKKKLLQEIKFNESLSQYGHEDTLFGYELKKRNIIISHIDNPILNKDIEDNSTYLEKTKKGIENLVHIVNHLDIHSSFIEDVTLLRFHQKIVSKKMDFILFLIYKCTKPFIYFLLKNGWINLKLFDFYKLGLFIELSRKSKNG